MCVGVGGELQVIGEEQRGAERAGSYEGLEIAMTEESQGRSGSGDSRCLMQFLEWQAGPKSNAAAKGSAPSSYGSSIPNASLSRHWRRGRPQLTEQDLASARHFASFSDSASLLSGKSPTCTAKATSRNWDIHKKPRSPEAQKPRMAHAWGGGGWGVGGRGGGRFQAAVASRLRLWWAQRGPECPQPSPVHAIAPAMSLLHSTHNPAVRE